MATYYNKKRHNCPNCKCKNTLELDYDLKDGGTLVKFVCTECGYEADWKFVTDKEAMKDREKFLKRFSKSH